jgi:hypothetical protein
MLPITINQKIAAPFRFIWIFWYVSYAKNSLFMVAKAGISSLCALVINKVMAKIQFVLFNQINNKKNIRINT